MAVSRRASRSVAPVIRCVSTPSERFNDTKSTSGSTRSRPTWPQRPSEKPRQLHHLATNLQEAVLGVVDHHEDHGDPVVRGGPQLLDPEERVPQQRYHRAVRLRQLDPSE